MKKVNFIHMDKGTKEDYKILDYYEKEYAKKLPRRILESLKLLKDGLSGYKVDRLEHSLQAATRALYDNADIELVVAALIHDIGDTVSPYNHSQVSASIIRPYVREEVTWIVEMHGIFQMYYYADKLGLDKNLRDKYNGHKWFKSCEKFCYEWDQMSFDPEYVSKDLEYFTPLIEEIFNRDPFDLKFIHAD